MKLRLNNAVVRVSGVEETRVINLTYYEFSCIEELSPYTVEKEYEEKLGRCIRIHFGDGDTATFSMKSKLVYEVL